MRFFNAQRPTLNAQLSIQTGGRWTLVPPEPAQNEGGLDIERLLAINRSWAFSSS
jgi:hypothetical protein